ncbi:MAG: hypothetical protein RL141_1086 [Candidatus Parcubacteria bacterium]|jgi:hypothetical protein
MRRPFPIFSSRRAFLAAAVLLFLVLAPLAVFYTAGYRWNPKKGMIERNGTLILDSVPAGATIFLNGQAIEERTPVTLQRVTPGTYQVRLELDGHAPWEKTLDVRSERVTFATGVHLWPMAAPGLVREGLVRGASLAPDGETWAIVEETAGDVQLILTPLPASGAGEGTIFRFDSGAVPQGALQFLWDEASANVVVQDKDGQSWFAGLAGDTRMATLLPAGVYRWNEELLLGVRDGQQFEYTPREGRIRQTPFPVGVRDTQGDFSVVAAAGGGLAVVPTHTPERQFVLPPGGWIFAEPFEDYLFLRREGMLDGRENWFGFRPDEAARTSIALSSDAPPQRLMRKEGPSLLAYAGGEVWMAMLGEVPQLLFRGGETVRGAAWHPDGTSIFYALKTGVSVIELDPRGGRYQQSLMAFSDIRGITIFGETLYVVGAHEGKEGIWSMLLE